MTDVQAILEQTHPFVLQTIHDTLQKEAQRYSTVLQNQSFTDYFHENTPITSLDTNQYLDDIVYYSHLCLKTEKNHHPSIGIQLTTEAYFPPLFTRCLAWNLHGEYDFSWKSVNDIMKNMSYSTTWTIHYKSTSLVFSYDGLDEPYQFFQQECDNNDTEALEEARQAITKLLNP